MKLEKVEKFRKFVKVTQLVGMIVIVVVGMALLYFFGIRNSGGVFSPNSAYIIAAVVVIMFMFLTFVGSPMQNKLLKLIILTSLNGLVSDVTFNKKKGFQKSSFEKLGLVSQKFGQYGCSDYYSFIYNDSLIESTTVRAFDEIKVNRPTGKKGKIKQVKETVNYFFGRVYIIPYTSNVKFNIYGKKIADVSRRKELANSEYKNEYPIKVKKYSDAFEIFYSEQKPDINMSIILERLLTLKIQSKGAISLFVRNNKIILCIDNSHYYQEVEIKKPIDRDLIKEYRKDVSTVLTFINSINILNKKETEV